MPRKLKRDGGFRLNRSGVFFTYSDAAAIDAVGGKQAIVDHLLSISATCRYLIGREIHPTTGEPHYHCIARFTPSLDTSDARFLDINGCHPNIDAKAPGKGCEAYSIKDKDFVTNYYKQDPWTRAANATTLKAATDILWSELPQDMAKHGHNIEENLRKKLKPEIPPAIQFYGPFDKKFYPPEDWNPKTHSLLIIGPAGIGKTQFAKYYFGDFEYYKSSPERLKDATFEKPLILDEFNYLPRDPEQSKEITDVISGGTLAARYKDIVIPPGVPRIFLSNFRCFKNPDSAVYERRCVVMDLTPRAPSPTSVMAQFEDLP